MVATIATFNSILKEFYLGPVQEQLNNEVLVLELMEKASVDWNGRLAHIPVHLARNAGADFAALAAGAGPALPAAGQQTWLNYTVNATFLYGRFEVTGPAIASAGKGGKNTFIGWMDAEMDYLVKDVRNRSDESVFSGGRMLGFLNERRTQVAGNDWEFTGDIAKVEALRAVAAAGTLEVVFVRHDFGNAAAWGFLNDAGGNPVTPAAVSTVTAVDPAAGTITIGSTGLNTEPVDPGFAIGVYCVDQTVAVQDIVGDITVADAEPTGIYGNLGATINGLAAAQVRNHFGIDVVANPLLQSNILTMAVVAGAGPVQGRAALDLDRMQSAFDTVLVRSDDEPNCIVMHPQTRQQYVAILQGVLGANLFTMTNKAEKGDGGFTGLAYGGVPIKTARHMARGGIAFLTLGTWKMLELQPGGFADLDGNVLSRVADQDSWEGFYRWYYNTICMRPNANALLVGINLV